MNIAGPSKLTKSARLCSMDTTVRVCASNDKEAQDIASTMTPPIKTTHGCEKFFWDMCFG